MRHLSLFAALGLTGVAWSQGAPPTDPSNSNPPTEVPPAEVISEVPPKAMVVEDSIVDVFPAPADAAVEPAQAIDQSLLDLFPGGASATFQPPSQPGPPAPSQRAQGADLRLEDLLPANHYSRWTGLPQPGDQIDPVTGELLVGGDFETTIGEDPLLAGDRRVIRSELPADTLLRGGFLGGGLLGDYQAGIELYEPGRAGAVAQSELLPTGVFDAPDEEGFTFGIGINGTFDSNPYLDEDNPEEDYSVAVAPWVAWQSAASGGARFIARVRYAPFLRAYLNNDDLNTIDQAGFASLDYFGKKLQLGASVSYSQFQRTDRFAGTYVDASNFSFMVNGSYEVSDKTLLDASYTWTKMDYDDDEFEGSDAYTLRVTGFWRATPMLRIGPSIEHTEITSDNTGTQEILALLLRLEYELTGKISLAASAGVQFEDDSRSGNETQFIGGLNVRYNIDDLWSLAAQINYRTIPSPADENYSVGDWAFNAALTRALRNGSISLGGTANFSNYDAVGPVTVSRSDEQTYGLFLAYRGRLYNRINWDTAIRYTTNSGDEDWDRFQVTIGLNYAF